jgi:hypothetical protein
MRVMVALWSEIYDLSINEVESSRNEMWQVIQSNPTLIPRQPAVDPTLQKIRIILQ